LSGILRVPQPRAIWTAIGSNTLGAIGATISPAPLGSGNYSSVISKWCSGVFGNNQLIIAANGGHSDYAGNEVYAFNYNSKAWSLLRSPTTNAIITSCDALESTGLYSTDATGATADPQAPRARHGYSMEQWCTYKSKVALMGAVGIYPSGQINSSVIRYYDPVANTWETGPTILTPFNGAYSATCEDSSGNLWFTGQGTGGRLNRIVPSTGVVTEFGNAFMFSLNAYYRTGVYDPIHNYFWIFGGDGTNTQVGYWDLGSGSTIDFTSVTPTGSLNIAKQPAPGAGWYPANNKIILWSGGSALVEFDTSTYVFRDVVIDPASAVIPTTAQPNGTYGRFRWTGSSFIGLNAASESVYECKINFG